MSETKPKRQLTEEQLAKLAEARKKALAVRQKHSVVRHAEKLEKKKQIDAKYREILDKDAPPPAPPKEEPKPTEQEAPPSPVKQAKKPKQKKVLAPASDESSSDTSSDEEYDASPLMAKYKQKYKSKYEAKYTKSQQQTMPYGFSHVYNDAVVIAKQNLQNKLTNELKRVAMNSLFG